VKEQAPGKGFLGVISVTPREDRHRSYKGKIFDNQECALLDVQKVAFDQEMWLPFLASGHMSDAESKVEYGSSFDKVLAYLRYNPYDFLLRFERIFSIKTNETITQNRQKMFTCEIVITPSPGNVNIQSDSGVLPRVYVGKPEQTEAKAVRSARIVAFAAELEIFLSSRYSAPVPTDKIPKHDSANQEDRTEVKEKSNVDLNSPTKQLPVEATVVESIVEPSVLSMQVAEDNHFKDDRPVAEIDLGTGIILRSFSSIRQAAESICRPKGFTTILRCCIGKTRTAYGFNWEFDTRNRNPISVEQSIGMNSVENIKNSFEQTSGFNSNRNILNQDDDVAENTEKVQVDEGEFGEDEQEEGDGEEEEEVVVVV